MHTNKKSRSERHMSHDPKSQKIRSGSQYEKKDSIRLESLQLANVNKARYIFSAKD